MREAACLLLPLFTPAASAAFAHITIPKFMEILVIFDISLSRLYPDIQKQQNRTWIIVQR
jgi:hypothetical protein